jgi:hypothetical protein
MRGLGIDQPARAEDADEEFDHDHLGRRAVDQGGLLPAKSTKNFSPARWTWRIDGLSVRAHRR